MDLTHKLTLALLVALVGVTGAMLVQHRLVTAPIAASDPAIDLRNYYTSLQEKNSRLYAPVTQLIEQKRFTAALEQLDAIRTAHPDNPMHLVYLARIRYGQGKIADGVHAYRQAVEQMPDLIDSKTPLYIGESIMALIGEGRGKLSRELRLKPGDPTIKQALDDMHYLQRRIAGGCE